MNKKIISLAILTGLFCCASLAVAVTGCPTGQICNPLSKDTFEGLLEDIAANIGIFIAALGTIMIVVSGILYLLSAGSPEKIGTAKKALIYAIMGIAIGLSAQAIVLIVKKIIGAE